MQNVVGKYQLLRRIGQDQLGTLFQAQDSRSNRLVMLRRLDFMSPNLIAYQWRVREIVRTLIHLKHPNMISIVDAFEEADHFYLIQEFWRGEPLSRWLRDMGRMSVKFALPILMRVLNAFETAHQQGIICGHLTTDSIILAGYHQPKIVNFGLLYLLQQNDMLPIERFVQSNAYAAPEQLMRPAKVNFLTDVYQIGMLTYQMLSGKLPFSQISDHYLIRKRIAAGQILSVLNFPQNIPDSMRQFIHHALQPLPEKRFPNIKGMMKSLLNIRTRNVERPPIRKHPEAHPRKPKRSLAVMVLILNICLIALIVALWIDKYPGKAGMQSESSASISQPAPAENNTLTENVPQAGPVRYPGAVTAIADSAREPSSRRVRAESRESKDEILRKLLSEPNIERPAARIGGAALLINSIPSDARIEILHSGRSIRKSRTPARFYSLPAGELAIRIIHIGGYQVYEREINLRRGKTTTIEAVLKPLPFTLMINSEPPGAQIEINGKRMNGQTPLTVTVPNAGEQHIRFFKPGYRETETTVFVTPNQRQYHVTRKLPGQPINCTIQLLYPGRIYLNGVPQNYESRLTHQLSNIYPGKYSLMVLYENKQSQIKSLEITRADNGKTIDIYP
ncbi:PEGA domain-containing protein [candidate division KSB1 bacterium]|nr:PEGA domain-containing protein [candidate division KSB1 bacterium]